MKISTQKIVEELVRRFPDQTEFRKGVIVDIAKGREISPSDPEIQARLEVGRPRLSQIYNQLHKSGILAVRKDGRSRLFRLSTEALEILGGV